MGKGDSLFDLFIRKFFAFALGRRPHRRYRPHPHRKSRRSLATSRLPAGISSSVFLILFTSLSLKRLMQRRPRWVPIGSSQAVRMFQCYNIPACAHGSSVAPFHRIARSMISPSCSTLSETSILPGTAESHDFQGSHALNTGPLAASMNIKSGPVSFAQRSLRHRRERYSFIPISRNFPGLLVSVFIFFNLVVMRQFSGMAPPLKASSKPTAVTSRITASPLRLHQRSGMRLSHSPDDRHPFFRAFDAAPKGRSPASLQRINVVRDSLSFPIIPSSSSPVFSFNEEVSLEVIGCSRLYVRVHFVVEEDGLYATNEYSFAISPRDLRASLHPWRFPPPR